MTVILAMAVGASATAGPPVSAKAQIEKLVRGNVVAVAQHKHTAAEISLADDVLVYMELGTKPAVDADTRLGDTFYADNQATVEHAPETVDVVVDEPAGVAWFDATYRVKVTGPMDPKDVSRTEERAAGIAVRGAHGWQIEAIAYGFLETDHDLVTGEPRFRMQTMPDGPPKLTGDAPLAQAAAAWIASGFSGHAAAAAGALASGSSPGEHQAGAGVAKLVKTWDALGLRADSIEATVLPGGAAGFVHADVAFPIKGTKRAAPLVLNVGAIREADGWHWVLISYGAPMLM
jgi:hypothetical protein